MRAIIIDDKDAKALLDQLKLEAFEDSIGYAEAKTQDAWHTIPATTRKEIVERIHRRFHFRVYRWLQDQGAIVTG